MDFCVCCGAYVPEGRMVCFNCENGALQYNAPPQKHRCGWIRTLINAVRKRQQYEEIDYY